MTPEEFTALRALEDHRVQLTFHDGQVVIATLVSTMTDFDSSRHLAYEDVEWSALPHLNKDGAAWYVAGEDLVSCVAWPLRA